MVTLIKSVKPLIPTPTFKMYGFSFQVKDWMWSEKHNKYYVRVESGDWYCTVWAEGKKSYRAVSSIRLEMKSRNTIKQAVAALVR